MPDSFDVTFQLTDSSNCSVKKKIFKTKKKVFLVSCAIYLQTYMFTDFSQIWLRRGVPESPKYSEEKEG